jgi:hypothetical protein
MKSFHKEAPFHFFGCNGWEWKTSADLFEVVDWFQTQRYNNKKMKYSLWVVPLAHDAEYKISQYAPQVDGAQFMGTYIGKKKVETIYAEEV